MSDNTATTSLKNMSLNDFILSKASLDNIIETDELNATLEDYVTQDSLNENIDQINNNFTHYVRNETFDNLNAQVQELTLSAEAVSSYYAGDKNTLFGAKELLYGALDDGKISVRVVDEFVQGSATPGTIYFVKSTDDTDPYRLSAMYYIPINSNDNSNVPSIDPVDASESTEPTDGSPTTDTIVAASAPLRKRKTK